MEPPEESSASLSPSLAFETNASQSKVMGPECNPSAPMAPPLNVDPMAPPGSGSFFHVTPAAPVWCEPRSLMSAPSSERVELSETE